MTGVLVTGYKIAVFLLLLHHACRGEGSLWNVNPPRKVMNRGGIRCR